MVITRRLALVPAIALAVVGAASVVAAPPATAATQTWVSGVGDDVNPCSRTAPCKTFAGAISKTDAGGTISVLDPGGFGAVTITKSITIDGSGVEAGILNSLVNGIIVNAAATDRVVLRGLDIYGGYAAAPGGTCSPNAINGIRVVQAGSVVVEDVRIANSRTSGIQVAPTAGTTNVTISGSAIRVGCGPALDVAPAAGATATVQVTDSVLSLHDVGVRAGEGATVRMTAATVFGNSAAVQTSGNGVVDTSDAANHLVANEPVGIPTSTSAVGGATRTWVSGVGDDANPCSRTAPCKTLAGALSKTFTGGEINLLDNASIGQVTIAKPITIDATGAAGRINVPAAGVGIIVNAPATTDVILRGLDIQGTWSGAADCPVSSAVGVKIISARSVHIERTSIQNFAGAGIEVVPTSAPTRVVVSGSAVTGVCGSAVRVAPSGGITAAVLLRDSGIVGNGTGITATAGASVWLNRGALTGNATPTAATGGTIEQLSDAPPAPPAPEPEPAPTVTVTADPAPAVTVTADPAPAVTVAGGGTTTEPAVVKVAQQPVACRTLPKRLRPGRTITLLDNTCVTTAGQRVAVSAKGKAGKLLLKSRGKVLLRTSASGGKLTLTLSAPGTATHLPLLLTRSYRVR